MRKRDRPDIPGFPVYEQIAQSPDAAAEHFQNSQTKFHRACDAGAQKVDASEHDHIDDCDDNKDLFVAPELVKRSVIEYASRGHLFEQSYAQAVEGEYKQLQRPV